jgi:hypothetical protein
MIDTIIHIVNLIVIVVLIVDNVVQRKLQKTAATMYAQEAINNAALKIEYGKLDQEFNSLKIEKNDGFVKFLSDSRDWAFNYIEEAQAANKKFATVVAPQLEWAMTYGSAVSSPHYDVIKSIYEAYKELEKTFPNEDGAK